MLYSFKCVCGNKFEKLVAKRIDSYKCAICGSIAKRVEIPKPSAELLNLKQHKWSFHKIK